MFVSSVPRIRYGVERRHARFLFTVPISVHRYLSDRPSTIYGISLDISEGGMAAAVCGRPEVGETVDIKVGLPNGDSVVRAVVRYNNEMQSGFEFFELAPAVRRHIATIAQKPATQDTVFTFK